MPYTLLKFHVHILVLQSSPLTSPDACPPLGLLDFKPERRRVLKTRILLGLGHCTPSKSLVEVSAQGLQWAGIKKGWQAEWRWGEASLLWLTSEVLVGQSVQAPHHGASESKARFPPRSAPKSTFWGQLIFPKQLKLWTKCLANLKFHMLKSSLRYDGIWRWGLWEVMGSWGWHPSSWTLFKTSQSGIAPFPSLEDMAGRQPSVGQEASSHQSLTVCWHLVLSFQPSELWEINSYCW